MRISLPAGLVVWSVIGGVLVALSLLLIACYPAEPGPAFTLILVVFALWTAAGVEGLFRIEGVWQPPWNLLSVIVAAALPFVLILAALSQCLTLRTRGHFSASAERHQAHSIVMQDFAQNRGVGR